MVGESLQSCPAAPAVCPDPAGPGDSPKGSLKGIHKGFERSGDSRKGIKNGFEGSPKGICKGFEGSLKGIPKGIHKGFGGLGL